MTTLRWDSLTQNDAYHVTSLTLRGRSSFYSHDHDFAELFLVDYGEGVHHVAGRRLSLAAGDLVTILPAQEHAFQAQSAGGFRYLNVAFPVATLDWFRDTYLTDLDGLWVEGRVEPVCHHLSPGKRRLVHRGIDELSLAPRMRSEIDRFLLDLLHELREPLIGPPASDMPPWLRRAWEGVRSGPAEKLSVESLVALAGRSHEHVARATRTSTGLTPTQMVNALRLARAAHLLSMTEDDITRIALDCGFQNIGHFYTVFRGRYGTTPRRYRLRSKGLTAEHAR